MSSMSLQMQHNACVVSPLVWLHFVSEQEHAAEIAMMVLACLFVRWWRIDCKQLHLPNQIDMWSQVTVCTCITGHQLHHQAQS